MRCACCKTVNALCFWGPRPEKGWKRPWLLTLALVLMGVSGLLLWALRGHQHELGLAVLALFLVSLSGLGIVVAIKGCDACVARVFGDF
ncbi:hypothetical protein [Roseateles cavernae]|uniref:hypothetical protein n=1 Tax=Roseateles cavernae TaxID=3153578 RepID=UPI0032E4645F